MIKLKKVYLFHRFLSTPMLRPQQYENHHLILDQLDHHEDYHPKSYHMSNISSTSSPDINFRVIKDGRVSSSEVDQNYIQPPKNLQVITEEPSSSADLGMFFPILAIHVQKMGRFQTKSIKNFPCAPLAFSFLNSFTLISLQCRRKQETEKNETEKSVGH